MKKSIPLLAAFASVIALAGCAASAPPTFASPSALHKAYVAAGGDCADPTEVPEAMVSEGAHALMCADVTFLIVFDSEEQKNGYLASVLDDENPSEAVVGERWVVMTEDGSEFADELGGKIERS